jgi:hypothetical protein
MSPYWMSGLATVQGKPRGLSDEVLLLLLQLLESIWSNVEQQSCPDLLFHQIKGSVLEGKSSSHVQQLFVVTQRIICYFTINCWRCSLSSGSVAPTANDREYSRVTLK